LASFIVLHSSPIFGREAEAIERDLSKAKEGKREGEGERIVLGGGALSFPFVHREEKSRKSTVHCCLGRSEWLSAAEPVDGGKAKEEKRERSTTLVTHIEKGRIAIGRTSHAVSPSNTRVHQEWKRQERASKGKTRRRAMLLTKDVINVVSVECDDRGTRNALVADTAVFDSCITTQQGFCFLRRRKGDQRLQEEKGGSKESTPVKEVVLWVVRTRGRKEEKRSAKSASTRFSRRILSTERTIVSHKLRIGWKRGQYEYGNSRRWCAHVKTAHDWKKDRKLAKKRELAKVDAPPTKRT
jgi:hypothetical protein